MSTCVHETNVRLALSAVNTRGVRTSHKRVGSATVVRRASSKGSEALNVDQQPPGAGPAGLSGARPPIKEGDYVKSLARGLLVIRSFDADNRSQTLSEVARRTGLSRATARRLLLTLRELGYVGLEGRAFALAPGTLQLGYSYLSALGAPEIAQPFIQTLAEETHESCSMTVLDDTEIVYVARAVTQRLFSVSLSIGSRLPAFCTSTGRVLLADCDLAEVERVVAASDLIARTDRTATEPAAILAEIEKARTQGWYLLDQELELGLRAIAAPVRDRTGRVVAAVNVSTAVARMTRSHMVDAFVPLVVKTANDISAALSNR